MQGGRAAGRDPLPCLLPRSHAPGTQALGGQIDLYSAPYSPDEPNSDTCYPCLERLLFERMSK